MAATRPSRETHRHQTDLARPKHAQKNNTKAVPRVHPSQQTTRTQELIQEYSSEGHARHQRCHCTRVLSRWPEPRLRAPRRLLKQSRRALHELGAMRHGIGHLPASATHPAQTPTRGAHVAAHMTGHQAPHVGGCRRRPGRRPYHTHTRWAPGHKTYMRVWAPGHKTYMGL